MTFGLELTDLLLLLLLDLLKAQLEDVGGLVSLVLCLREDGLGLAEF